MLGDSYAWVGLAQGTDGARVVLAQGDIDGEVLTDLGAASECLGLRAAVDGAGVVAFSVRRSSLSSPSGAAGASTTSAADLADGAAEWEAAPTINRWRMDYLQDFAHRLDRLVNEPA
ncbi:MAG TPA: hypothetical protein PKM36_07250 [Propionibacteriaceae bacterium]|nr:hypothetical protein [Propionibacteriaceae bacterium]